MSQEASLNSHSEHKLIQDLKEKKVIPKLNNFQNMYLNELLGLSKKNGKKKLTNKSKMNSKDFMDDQRMDNEAQIEEYWSFRCFEAWRYSVVCSFSHFYFQVIALAKPMSEAQVPVNICYMAGTLVCYALLFYAKKKNKYMKEITYGVNLYLIFRNSIRMMDFEQTKDKYENLDKWYFMCVIQS